MDPAHPAARRAGPAADLAAQRCARPSPEADSAEAGQLATLARLVAEAAGVTTAIADDQYTITAVMLEQDCCGLRHTLLVELLEDHLRADEGRWTAIAIDELDQQMAQPGRGRTAADALRGIDWCQLVPAT
jgi:hypothetical protein